MNLRAPSVFSRFGLLCFVCLCGFAFVPPALAVDRTYNESMAQRYEKAYEEWCKEVGGHWDAGSKACKSAENEILYPIEDLNVFYTDSDSENGDTDIDSPGIDADATKHGDGDDGCGETKTGERHYRRSTSTTGSGSSAQTKTGTDTDNHSSSTQTTSGGGTTGGTTTESDDCYDEVYDTYGESDNTDECPDIQSLVEAYAGGNKPYGNTGIPSRAGGEDYVDVALSSAAVLSAEQLAELIRLLERATTNVQTSPTGPRWALQKLQQVIQARGSSAVNTREINGVLKVLERSYPGLGWQSLLAPRVSTSIGVGIAILPDHSPGDQDGCQDWNQATDKIIGTYPQDL